MPLVVAASQLALSLSLSLPPTPPYRRLSYVVFVFGTIEDCIRGVQNVVSLFQAFTSWGTRLTLLSEGRELAKLLSAAYKKRHRPAFYILLGVGGGGWGANLVPRAFPLKKGGAGKGEKKLSVQFYF